MLKENQNMSSAHKYWFILSLPTSIVVREHYLRDDIYCGATFCKSCVVSSARLSSSRILVVDTNVVLHQIDLLENPAIDNVVVLSVVLEEVKNKNISVYNRLRALCSNSLRKFFVFSNEYHKDTYVKAMPGESPNDRNDREFHKWSLKLLSNTNL
ncbi:PREDICTED: exosome complex exonuclease RRP44 homolog A-like isoform X2 [Ipomoea nil]|uniref:exosome complex exonuclease RRP44 homolog A-like isoform X2 n=1 Tax=Ipomoea nil TaxID=35883 RepID=UPI00090112A2|nr:PREDICTED: exosome complex exonuclease RRP44 homolog A-like isoform X2 [Ipomoea nil]XP_019158045.1 PREDICTED: exosome complex exonuclease RRP44 homolog A-like isoform X2 [Ipomoea nil]